MFKRVAIITQVTYLCEVGTSIYLGVDTYYFISIIEHDWHGAIHPTEIGAEISLLELII